MVTRRATLLALTGFAGCTTATHGATNDTTTPVSATATTTASTTSTTPTVTPYPPVTINLPNGPLEPPERPDPLTESSVREYVETYEYRYVYNYLYREDGSPTVSASVAEVIRTPVGWAVGVQARGHVNYGSGTTTAHADYGGQPMTYLVDENSTIRLLGKPEKHVDTTTTVD